MFECASVRILILATHLYIRGSDMINSDRRYCLLQSLLSNSWLFAFQSASIYHLDAYILSGVIQIVSQIVLLRSLKPHCCLLIGALGTYMRDTTI